MKGSRQTTKAGASPRFVSYRFSAFVRAIDDLPVSQIKMTTEDYQKCIAWDVAKGKVRTNQNIQKFLRFGRFLESGELPENLSRFERSFYRRTAGRMVHHVPLSAKVLAQFQLGLEERKIAHRFDR
jgi:hypothetical protein